MLCDSYATDDAYERYRSAFLMNHDIWAHDCVKALEFFILCHILFLMKPDIQLGLFELRDQIERSFSFVLTLIVDIFLELDIARLTRREHLECCVSLLHEFILKYMPICQPMLTKGVYREDLIKVHCISSSQEIFRRRGDWLTFMDDLKSELVAWHPAWSHENEVLMYGANKNLILLTSLGGFKQSPLPQIFARFMLKMTLANQKIALQSWKDHKKSRKNDPFGEVNRV